jgi:hypothetical protein
MSKSEFKPGASLPAIDAARSALLLDIDGTLLDIAENPDAVSVPAELHDVLARLHRCFGGAVALISGRSVSRIDALFPAFLVCRFWLADARWGQGRKEEARDLFRDALRYRNHFGLLSEDVHPATGALWGNFPQTYSLAGLILTAKRLSRSWEDRYRHGSS